MHEEDKEKLRSYLEVIQSAFSDLDEVYENGYMSDAKSAVYNLPIKLTELAISDPFVCEELVVLAKNCWSVMYLEGAESGPYARAGRAQAEIGKLEQRIKSLMGNEN